MASASKPSGDDFPILCETCLGPNPYVRMLKQPWGSACKVCERPFTSFRWRPAGHGTRPKKTEVCQTCARAKNVCQTCLLDLQFGLPVQVRDMSMAAGDRQRTIMPKSDGTREYAAAQSERAIANGEIDAVYKAAHVNKIAERAKRTAPRYERNRARICSFFVKGTCTRGLYCPYRHEKPDENAEEDELADQNLRDRYYGVNDPVAVKILQKSGVAVDGRKMGRRDGGSGQGPPPLPSDPTIQTLFIGGITDAVRENDVIKLFKGHGPIVRLSVLHNKGIAFVELGTREAAEKAMQALYGQKLVNGARLFINWGRGGSKRARPVSEQQSLHQGVGGGGGFDGGSSVAPSVAVHNEVTAEVDAGEIAGVNQEAVPETSDKKGACPKPLAVAPTAIADIGTDMTSKRSEFDENAAAGEPEGEQEPATKRARATRVDEGRNGGVSKEGSNISGETNERTKEEKVKTVKKPLVCLPSVCDTTEQNATGVPAPVILVLEPDGGET